MSEAVEEAISQSDFAERIQKSSHIVEGFISEYDWYSLKTFITTFEVSEIAEIFLTVDSMHWPIIYRILPRALALDVFMYLDPQVSASLIEKLSKEDLRQILRDIPPDDRTALLEELPGVVTRKLLRLLSKEDFKESMLLLGYPEDSVGRMMTTDYLAVNVKRTVGETIAFLREKSAEKEFISTLYIIDKDKNLQGFVLLKKLLAAKDEQIVGDIMKTSVVSLAADLDQEEAIGVFRSYDVPSLPVTDSKGVLIGIVTFDDIFDVVEEEVTEDIQKSSAISPLEFRYWHTPAKHLFRKRIVWLIFLLVTAFFSAGILSAFTDYLSHFVVLTYFLPVLIGAGGNTGAQSATLIIRALSTGEFHLNQWYSAFKKELLVGFLLGLTLAILMFFLSYFFTMNWRIQVIASSAMLFLVLWANLVGAMLPLLISRMKFDPAVVSNPFLATLVDATGLLIYLGIASLFLNF